MRWRLRLTRREPYHRQRAEDCSDDADPRANQTHALLQLRSRAPVGDAHQAVSEVKRQREGAERIGGGEQGKTGDGRRKLAREGDDGLGRVAITRDDGQSEADEMVSEEEHEHGAAQPMQGEPGASVGGARLALPPPSPDEIAEERVEAEREPEAERLEREDPG